MAKLLFVVETFADVSSGALDEVCQGVYDCVTVVNRIIKKYSSAIKLAGEVQACI